MSYPLKKLSEILSKEKFSIWKIKTKEYLESWDFPVIDQWKNLVSWYWNDEKLVYTWKLPVLVYWDHTNSLKFVDFPFIAWADWIKVLSFNNNCDIKFCYYLIENFKPVTQGYRRHYSFFKDINLPLPPLPTQKAIVQKLDEAFARIDASIELAEKNLKGLEEMNASVLEEVFGSGEYEEKTLSEVTEKITDGSHNPPKWIEKGIPMISSRNLEMNDINFDNIRYISDEDYIKENKRTDVQEWDILLSIVWTIWKVCVVKKEFWKFTMQRSLAVVKLKQEKLFPMYVYYYFCSELLQKILNDWANWAAQKWIYLNQLKQIKIPLPPLSKQKEIVEYLDRVFAVNAELKGAYEEKIQSLKELKQSLLREAFEGRLVKE